MKRKIFSILLALVLLLSFSLVTAAPAAAETVDREILNQTRLASFGGSVVAEWDTEIVYSGDYSVHGAVLDGEGDFFNIVHMDIGDGTPITLGEINTIQFMEYLVSAGGSADLSVAAILFLNEPGTPFPAEGVTPTPWGDCEDAITFHNNGVLIPTGEWSIQDLSAEGWVGYLDSDPDLNEDGVPDTVEPLSYWLADESLADWEVAWVSIAAGAGDWAGYEGYIDNVMVDWTGGVDTYLTEPRIINATQSTGHNYIQDTIDAASADDTITVAAGTYREYLHITTDGLIIEGAGIDESIIDLDGLIPYWHYAGCSSSFASRAGVLITGCGSPDEIIEGVTFSGFTVQNAGLNPPITATGTHDGSDDASTLTDSSASWVTDELVGEWVHNVSDKLIEIDISGNNPIRSYGLITANDATTVTATLAKGLENDWDIGDTYEILPYEQYVDVAEDLQDDVPGIAISNGKDVSILYCKVINSGSVGINAGYARCVSAHKYSEGVTIDHCIVSDHPSRGISLGCHVGPVTITNNVCSNNGSPHPTDPSRQYMGTGIYVAGKSSILMASGLIANNTCENSGFIGISLAKYTDGVIIEDNTVTGSNFDEDGAGIFTYHNDHPEWCKNHIIRNNVVTGNIRGIVAYYTSYSTIEGNTITTDSGAFASGQAAIKIDGGNNITVKDNIISCDGVGIKVQNTWNHFESFDNTFTGNTITSAMFAGVFISHGAHDNTFEYNTITGTTTLTRWAGELYEETQGDGVFLWGYAGKEAGTGNVFHFNNIYENADDGMENQTATPVDATFNWWGDASGPYHATTNPSGTGDPVSDNVHYSTWCAIEDEDLVTPGYQVPTPMVWGVSTDGTIQEAIVVAVAGDTINVAAGTYSEALEINEALTLRGANAGVNPATETRLAESIIDAGGADRAVNILSNLGVVTFDGFTVQNFLNQGICHRFDQREGTTVHVLNNIVLAEPVSLAHGNSIQVSGDGSTVIGNDVTGASLEDPNWTGTAILVVAADNAVVRGNFVHDAQLGIGVAGYDTWGGPAIDNLIEHNTVQDCVYGISAQLDAQNTVIRYNDVLNNGLGQPDGCGIESQAVDWPAYFPTAPVTPSGTQIHYNNIDGNLPYGVVSYVYAGPGASDTVLAEVVDATNNYWGHSSGPSHSPGEGDPVGENVNYDPWLLYPLLPGEELPTTFDKTLPLNIGWTLVSTDSWIDPAESVGVGVILAYNYTPSGSYFQVDPTALVPVDALYLKTEIGGALGINYSGGVPVASSKNLEAGWNLMSSATLEDAKAVLSPLRYVQVGNEQGVALTTLVSQGNYNQHTGSFYLATLDPDDWTVLGATTLNPFDGYWVYMNAPKNFGVVPGH